MTVTGSLIHTLHRINRQKTDINSQLQKGPKLVAAAEARLKAAEDHVAATKDTLTKTKMEAHSKQLQMTEREQKIRSWQGKMNAAKENREYQALKDQIAADTQANSVLSDEILDRLESIDALGVALKEAEAEVQAKRKELETVKQQVADRRTVLEAELIRVQGNLEKAESQLTGDIRRTYLHLVASKADDAMAEVDGKVCGGCYQSLTPALLDKLSMDQPAICPGCGRLVYQNCDR